MLITGATNTTTATTDYTTGVMQLPCQKWLKKKWKW